MKEPLTDFGFEDIPVGEKTGRVRDLFSKVSSRYDLMNDLMSLGLHRCWKKSFVHRLPLQTEFRILDVAGGTGDIALLIQKMYPHLSLQISVVDLTPSMLEEGRDKAVNEGLLKGLEWFCGNAEQLPWPDGTFDIYTVAFGMRNITDKDQALREAWRVLKPGGWFFCLEFSQVTIPSLAKLYDLYSFQVLPRIGQWVSKNEAAYQYLVESIRQFPNQEQWKQNIEQAGFEGVSFENWSGGIVSMHRAKK
ncbi:class I SAM-dependent methyltransferase [Candidatus Finniella inopinata]|uniref:Ubiquinone/menaquinone biosynthesis C-methyltransferase UbiE n=1 Tax=Candidatus Finniella inopinata TaxID=1696036 RepID=A0A4Q7DIU5_9PROT|nr:class I SAM-dependent methyltransferase [Candidatus Finniella inopinata]RZI46035.1 class I SAM-dependent methyltransferase [Candidatus Finniella inopinata]